jgi:serine phosphatase RsbU (regulator of sigma subunit)
MQSDEIAPSESSVVADSRALDYQSSEIPTDFDLELTSERTRWLRRRFLWFCGANILFQILAVTVLVKDIRSAPALSRILNIIEPIVLVGGYLSAFIYVFRRRPPLETLLWLGLYITAALPSLSLILLRIDLKLDPVGWEVNSPNWPAGVFLAVVSPWVIFLLHFVACLFIPWTVRECLLPAAAMLIINTAIVVGDIIFTLNDSQRFTAIGALLLSIAAPLPGLLICWLRFSRFRKNFRLNFESLGYRKLQREIAGARRVHESSLPPRGLLTNGPLRLSYVYEPMRQIGGDILFVHPADNPAATSLSVLLVDVNGHGFGAALMANRVIGEIERLFAENPNAGPHQILSALNRYVHLTMAKSAVFATALCIRINTAANTLEYASGGHPPAFLRKADRSITHLDADTYLLGVIAGEEYCPGCKILPFHPGDAILAFTDGATEARDLAGEMLTIEGLKNRLGQFQSSPDRWPQALLQQIVTHRRAPADDDTLLVSIYRV